VAGNRAILAFFRNDFEQSRHHAEQWVELGRAADDPYELAHALVLLNIVLVATNTLEAATAAADEAVRVARAAGLDTALSLGLTRLALMLPIEDSERALALCDEAIEVASRIGDHMTVASANNDKAVIAGWRGDWHTALRASVDAAEQYLQIGALTTVFEPLYWAGVALCGLGYFEPAAVLIGTADAMAPEHLGPGWALPETAATITALIEALGEQHVATLAAKGAALEITDAIAYLRTEADRALAGP
jgi:tetratricopeptide (TPR) repeat protein